MVLLRFYLFMFGVIRLRVQKSYQEYHMCNMILNAPPIYISARPVCTSLRPSGGTVPMSLGHANGRFGGHLPVVTEWHHPDVFIVMSMDIFWYTRQSSLPVQHTGPFGNINHEFMPWRKFFTCYDAWSHKIPGPCSKIKNK